MTIAIQKSSREQIQFCSNQSVTLVILFRSPNQSVSPFRDFWCYFFKGKKYTGANFHVFGMSGRGHIFQSILFGSIDT